MTPRDFTSVHTRLGISRAELCRRIGIAPNSGTAYALGRKPIPLTVALACAAALGALPLFVLLYAALIVTP
jgi:transcriptional regulator with XRE-family HTH domain